MTSSARPIIHRAVAIRVAGDGFLLIPASPRYALMVAGSEGSVTWLARDKSPDPAGFRSGEIGDAFCTEEAGGLRLRVFQFLAGPKAARTLDSWPFLRQSL